MQAVDAADEFVFPCHHQLGGGRGRRRADVGDEVGNRHVAFVADGRDDGQGTRCDRARDGSWLKAQRSSIDPPPRPTMTTSTSGTRAIARSALGNFRGGALALHARRPNHDVRVRIASSQHVDDVADRGAVEGRHDADLARQRRQRPLARGVEQPLGLQALLELIEGELERAESLRLQVLADQLVLALRLVDRDLSTRDDAQARRRA